VLPVERVEWIMETPSDLGSDNKKILSG